MIELQYEGLKDLLQSLRVVNTELYGAVTTGLERTGDVVRRDAAGKFIEYGADGSSKRAASFVKAAEGFDTRVRPLTSTSAVVTVGQSLRKTRDIPRRRPNFGDLMMRKGLLPARNEKIEEAAAIMEADVVELLRANGF